jgi:hypothetical protein
MTQKRMCVPSGICRQLHPDFKVARTWSGAYEQIKAAAQYLIERTIDERLEPAPLSPADQAGINIAVQLTEKAAEVVEDLAFEKNYAEIDAMACFLWAAVNAGLLDVYVRDFMQKPHLLSELEDEEAILRACHGDLVKLTLAGISGFDMVAETSKARLWRCQFGVFWEPKERVHRAAPVGFNRGLHHTATAILEQMRRFRGLVRVEVKEERLTGGVHVEFLAHQAGQEGSVKKTAWLPAELLFRFDAKCYAEAFTLQQKLANAAEYGRFRSGRAKRKLIKDYEPILADQIVDGEDFTAWLKTQVALALKQQHVTRLRQGS